MEVVCIEDVRENDDGELWCAKGTLYKAFTRSNGRIYIHDDNHKEHTIYISEDAEMEEFYEKHFLEIKHYVD